MKYYIASCVFTAKYGFDTSALEQEKAELTDELNIMAGLIQDGIYQNAHMTQNQVEYNREYESLTARYENAKSRLDKVEAEIHDKHSRRKSIEHYLEIITERKEAVTEYDDPQHLFMIYKFILDHAA